VTPNDYCTQKAIQSGSSFYYSFRFLEPKRREAITALYAFCREVDDIVDEALEPSVAQVKLAYWRQEIGLVYQGAAQHPVGKALQACVQTYQVLESELQTVIDGMSQDLVQTRYAHAADLNAYCYKVAGVVGLMSAKIFGVTEAQTLDYAKALGISLQWMNILRDVGEDAQRGRIYLPADVLAKHQIASHDLLQGKKPAGFDAMMRELCHEAHARCDAARALLPSADRKAQRPGLMMATIYQRTLREIERQDYPVFSKRVSLSPIHKLYLAWRVWVS
jgi:15-cis-phytoene synthase